MPGAFGLRVSASVFLVDPTQNFGFDSFERSGPASITLQTASVPGGWLFESGFAEIDPTPEPTRCSSSARRQQGWVSQLGKDVVTRRPSHLPDTVDPRGPKVR